jgi:predicted nucleic acid-binding protein
VKAFFDTSVLVPVFYGDHEHHQASLSLFVQFTKDDACCGAHTLAEIYSTLTRMPGKYRVTGDQAMLFVGSVLERLSIIALSAEEYATALNVWSQAGVTGGTIYDALLASCALKAEAEAIYSWNLRHYRGFGAAVENRLNRPPASAA